MKTHDNTQLTDEELNDIVTIAQHLDAFGDEQSLRLFFQQQKDSLIDYPIKLEQVVEVEQKICQP